VTAGSTSTRLRRLSAIGIGIVISVGFMVVIFTQIDLAEVLAELRGVRVGIAALSQGTILVGFLMMTLRSKVLLRPLHRYSFYRLFRSVLVGFAGNNVLPLRMGELLRVEYLARHGGCAHSACLAVVATERLLDLLCLVLLFFGLLPAALAQMPSVPVLSAMGAALLVILVLLIAIGRAPDRFVAISGRLSRWMGARLSRFITDKTRLFARGLGSLRSVSSITAAAGCVVGFWMLVFVAFGNALPSTPAFIGTYHYFAILALTLLGVDPARAGAVAIVSHAMGIIPFTLVAMLLLLGDILRGELSLRGAPEETED
jgi:uncharacterized membrane protein YbhN (UPF0104 family)